MTDPDVVGALDRWIAETEAAGTIGPAKVLIVQARRARDEIVVLRTERDRLGQFVDGVKHHIAKARAEALEEAARVCERVATWHAVNEAHGCAAAIRALKEKP